MKSRGGQVGLQLEQALERELAPMGLHRPLTAADGGVDLTSDEGTIIIELKSSASGIRELDTAVARLALACRRQDAKRGILAWWAPRISLDRVTREWSALTELFHPALAERLQLVAVSPDTIVVLPPDERGARIATALQTAAAVAQRPAARLDRSYEVLKLLLLRWMRRDEPISIGDLQAQTNLSHPTVAKQVRALGNAVERGRDRSVTLREFPAREWNELTALSPRVRRSVYFEDRSRRSGDLSALVARLHRQRPPHVGLGGVIAARHWQPDFDLDGVPRIDLEVHAPDGAVDLRFVARLDPALAPARADAAPILAIHALARSASHFTAADGLPWADPVEVLLDLHELRLYPQADDFIRHWRERR